MVIGLALDADNLAVEAVVLDEVSVGSARRSPSIMAVLHSK
jgi:hypothetical protein